MNEYPAGSSEHQALYVADDGTPTTDYQVAVVPYQTRSTQLTGWADPTEDDGKLGVVIGPLPVGVYAIWAKAGSTLIRLGLVEITP